MGACGIDTILYVVATIFVMVAFSLTTAALFVCDFYRLPNYPEYGIGIYRVQPPDEYADSLSCYWRENFVEWLTDTNLTIARGFGSLAVIFSFGLWTILLCGLCCGCYKARCCRITFGILSAVCSVFSGLIFMALNSTSCESSSTSSCSISSGGVINIIGMVFFILAGFLFCFIPNPTEEAEPSAGVAQAAAPAAAAGGEVTVEKTEHADGTIVTKTTTVNPDGTATIEETTESPPEPEIPVIVN